MITYIQGDIFTSPATVLVNTVNTVGVMGKGIAKDFKAYFPEMFRKYQEACEAGELRIGTLQFYRTPHKSVLNFPTKRHWREKSRVEDIERGLQAFVARYADFSISSIAFPQLGCGNGELDWETQVRPLMEKCLASLPIDVYIHLYDVGTSFIEHQDPDEMKRWLQTEPESLPFSEFWDDLTEVIARRASESGLTDWSMDVDSSEEDERALMYAYANERAVLTTTELRHIWHQLRSFGLVSLDDLSDQLPNSGNALRDLLLELDYIKPTAFATMRPMNSANSERELRSLDQGIRLFPRVEEVNSTNQLELVGIS